MSEPTMTLDFNAIRSQVGHRLRYGRVIADWDDVQIANVDSVMRTGFRWACFPHEVRLPNGTLMYAYRFSWLTPVGTLRAWATVTPVSGATVVSNGNTVHCVLTFGGTSTIYDPEMVGKTVSVYTNDSNQTFVASGTIVKVSGSSATLATGTTIAAGTYRWGMVSDGVYQLWDDFGGFEGAYLTLEQGSRKPRVMFANESTLRDAARYSDESSTGWPMYASVRTIAGNEPTAPQRNQIIVWPVPNETCSLSSKYVRVLDTLSSVLRFPPGGAPYSELFLAACLAAAEKEIDDTRGADWEYYVKVVSMCAQHDAMATAPKIAGSLIRNQYGRSDYPLHGMNPVPTAYNGIPNPG